MISSFQNYEAGTANWRESLRRNRRRTFLVIATFFLIYLAIGILFDLYIYSGHYPQASLSQLWVSLITFRLFPIATFITFGIALLSLWATYHWSNKLMLLGTESREITPETAHNLEEKQLYNAVEEMKVAAGLRFMPRVYIIDADYMNAFASGYSEKSAMVAITRGLLEKLNREELVAVMAHELSHIRHMDIKLTLTASVLANLILIVMDILFFSAIFGGGNSREGRGRNQLLIIIMILRYLLPLVTILLVLYLSRTREYMADAGCVSLMRDNEPLARALLKIQTDHKKNSEAYSQAYSKTPHEAIRREAYIFDPLRAGIQVKQSPSDFFSTHPGIDNRLAAIGFIKKER